MSRRGAAERRQPNAELERRLGHRFAEPALLAEALTHSSAAGRGRPSTRNNERLEFLGDRVLGLAVADLLFTRFECEGEGALSRRHAGLVRKETLAEVAAGLGLGEWLVMARSEEEAGGRDNPSILADALEAVIGAVHRDAGPVVAHAVVAHHLGDRLEAMQAPPRDPKSTLQEWTQARGLGLPAYALVVAHGPPHAPVFEVLARLAEGPPEIGRGNSKRAAEQMAAERLLARLAGTGGTSVTGVGAPDSEVGAADAGGSAPVTEEATSGG